MTDLLRLVPHLPDALWVLAFAPWWVRQWIKTYRELSYASAKPAESGAED